MKYSEYAQQKAAIARISNVNVRNAALQALEQEFYSNAKIVREVHCTVRAERHVEQAQAETKQASTFKRVAAKSGDSKLSTAMQSYASKSSSSARAMFVRLCAQHLSDSEIASHADVLAAYDYDVEKIKRRVSSQCSAIRRHLLQFDDATCKTLKR